MRIYVGSEGSHRLGSGQERNVKSRSPQGNFLRFMRDASVSTEMRGMIGRRLMVIKKLRRSICAEVFSTELSIAEVFLAEVSSSEVSSSEVSSAEEYCSEDPAQMLKNEVINSFKKVKSDAEQCCRYRRTPLFCSILAEN
jgi:hypothetical protein